MAPTWVLETVRTGGDRLVAVLVEGRSVFAFGDQALTSSDGRRFRACKHLGRVQDLLLEGASLYAIGEKLGVSRDRGATWRSIKIPVLGANIELKTCIHHHSNGTWMIGGYGGILVSTSPLSGWKVLRKMDHDKVADISEHFGKTFVLGHQNGTLSGNELTPLAGVRTNEHTSLEGLVETPAGTLVAFGERLVKRRDRFAAVYRSTDEGASWKRIDVPEVGRPLDAEVCLWSGAMVAGSLVLVGDAGTVLCSTDDGKTFEKVPGGGPHRMWAIASSGDGAFIVCDEGTILELAPAPAAKKRPARRAR